MYCSFDRENVDERIFQTIFFVTSLVFPFVSIFWLYSNMLIRLWKGSAATHGPGPMRDKNSSRGKENKKRVTKMIVAVILVFLACWLPFQLVLLLKAYNVYQIREGSAALIFQIIANCLAYCNSCLNPILYAFFSPNFRSAFASIISCGKSNSPTVGFVTNDNGNKTANGPSMAARETVDEKRWPNRQGSSMRKAQVFEVEMTPLVRNGTVSTKALYPICLQPTI